MRGHKQQKKYIGSWNYFIHSFGLDSFGLIITVKERSENQNVDSSKSSLKNTNLTKETPIKKTIMKTITTSDLGTLELQNLQNRLSW